MRSAFARFWDRWVAHVVMAIIVLAIIAVVAVPLLLVAFFGGVPTWVLVIAGVVVVLAIIGYLLRQLTRRLPM